MKCPSTIEWISDKEMLVSFSIRKRNTLLTDTKKMNKSQKHCIASKKLDAKNCIQYNSIYMKIYRQKLSYSYEIRRAVASG